jgi:hypothetical protein
VTAGAGRLRLALLLPPLLPLLLLEPGCLPPGLPEDGIGGPRLWVRR